jgi:hypothetical protein
MAAVPRGVTATVIDDSAIPADRTFRSAWQVDGFSVAVEMTKAREIHKEHLREMRAPLLAESDVEFVRALELNDRQLQAEIAAKKQALRDVTADPSIAAARTPEQLKAAIPDALAAVARAR